MPYTSGVYFNKDTDYTVYCLCGGRKGVAEFKNVVKPIQKGLFINMLRDRLHKDWQAHMFHIYLYDL